MGLAHNQCGFLDSCPLVNARHHRRRIRGSFSREKNERTGLPVVYCGDDGGGSGSDGVEMKSQISVCISL